MIYPNISPQRQFSSANSTEGADRLLRIVFADLVHPNTSLSSSMTLQDPTTPASKQSPSGVNDPPEPFCGVPDRLNEVFLQKFFRDQKVAGTALHPPNHPNSDVWTRSRSPTYQRRWIGMLMGKCALRISIACWSVTRHKKTTKRTKKATDQRRQVVKLPADPGHISLSYHAMRK